MKRDLPGCLLRTSDKPAVRDDHGGITYRDLARWARAVAARIESLNLPPGARVGLLLPNSRGAVAAAAGAALSGRCLFPLNIHLTKAEMDALADRANVGVIVCNEVNPPDIACGDVPLLRISEILEDFETPAPIPCTSPDPDADFVCLGTSGSTGTPRIAVRTLRAMEANLNQVSMALDIAPADRFLSVVPFWHANGFSNCLLLPLANEAEILAMERFLPRQTLDAILDYRPTVVVGSPFIYGCLLRVLDPAVQLGFVRIWLSSGAPLPEDVRCGLRRLGIVVRQLYGSTETGTISISSGDPEHEMSGCVGRPVPGVRVRVVGEDGGILKPGEEGEIEVATPAMFRGYMTDGGEVEVPTSGGFRRMGDRGRIDTRGRLHLSGRSDGTINVGGLKVDPEEVRRVLHSIPQVRDAVVFGDRRSDGMQTVRAVVVADAGIDRRHILETCRRSLAEYKLPRQITFADEIPKDTMGKVPLNLLRK